MFAKLPDGRTIEEHYQCDIKGYDVVGTNWRLGKGKPPLYNDKNLWYKYLTLWRWWSIHNIDLLRELYRCAEAEGGVLSDCFAVTEINQARALSVILNELTRGLENRGG